MCHRSRRLIIVCLLLFPLVFLPTTSLNAASGRVTAAAAIWKPLQILWDFLFRISGQEGVGINSSEMIQDPIVSAIGCDKGIVLDPNGGGCSQ